MLLAINDYNTDGNTEGSQSDITCCRYLTSAVEKTHNTQNIGKLCHELAELTLSEECLDYDVGKLYSNDIYLKRWKDGNLVVYEIGFLTIFQSG